MSLCERVVVELVTCSGRPSKHAFERVAKQTCGMLDPFARLVKEPAEFSGFFVLEMVILRWSTNLPFKVLMEFIVSMQISAAASSLTRLLFRCLVKSYLV